MRRLAAVLCLAIAATSFTAISSTPRAAAAGVHPRLLFGPSDVAAIQAKVTSGVGAQAWTKLQGKVDAWTDPNNPGYVDPAYVRSPTNNKCGEWYDGLVGQNQMNTLLTDLGFAYVVSGDTKYGDHAARLLASLAACSFPSWHNNELGDGDLTRGVGLAFDWAYDRLVALGLLSTVVNALVAELPTLDASGTTTLNGVTNGGSVFSCLDRDWGMDALKHNWVGVCGGGNGLALLAIDGEAGVPSLAPYLSVARLRVTNHFSLYGTTGDGQEGATYASYGLHNSLPFALADGDINGTSLIPTAVTNVPAWLASEQLPGSGARFVPRNDSGVFLPGWYEVLPMFFAVAPSGLVGWLWDHTAGPQGDNVLTVGQPWVGHQLTGSPDCNNDKVNSAFASVFCWGAVEPFTILYHRDATSLPRSAPTDLTRYASEHGLVAMRSNNSGLKDGVVSTYEAKYNHTGGGHSQHDIGSFTLYGYGGLWALDSGYGHNYSCGAVAATGCTETDPTTFAGSAIGHNVIIIDNNRNSQRYGQTSTTNTVSTFVTGPNSTLIRSGLTSAYNGWRSAIRRVYFSRVPGEPVMLATSDVFDKDGASHTYEWRMHTDVRNAVTPLGDRFIAVAPNGASMAGAVSDRVSLARAVVTTPWQQPGLDEPVEHTLIQSLGSATSMDHLAVVAVVPSGAPVNVQKLACTGCNLVSASWTGGESLYASRQSGATSSARLTTNGVFAKVSLGRGETMLSTGSSLVADGTTYVSITGGSAVALVSGGNRIEVTGGTGTAYRVYAPQTITQVVVNGVSVSFTRSGDDIVF